MSSVCFSSIKGTALRTTRLDSLGKWVTGDTSTVVSKGFVKVDLKDNIESGQEYKKKTAGGELCINEKDRDLLNWIDVSVSFCKVDPEQFEMMTGQRLLTNYAGDSVGFTKGNVETVNFALEIWTEIPGTGTQFGRWIYWLLPLLTNGWAGDVTIENGDIDFMVKGNTQGNAYWGMGPYDVVAQDISLTPGPLLTPGVLDTEHLYGPRITEIAPPTAACGYVSLDVPWAA